MLRLGIIGVGGWGRQHVQGFRALQAEGRVLIAAVADVSLEALHDLAAQPDLKNTRFHTDYRELLAHPGLDAVVVNAPIPYHREITLAALERDLFILLEKPPVPLLSQLDELIEADLYDRVMVAFQHIYSGLAGMAKSHILSGHIGRLRSVSAIGIWPRPTSYYARAGWAGRLEWEGRAVLDGPCTNAFAHYLNLAFHLCGDDAGSFASPCRLRGEVYRARPQLSGYDTAFLSGELEGKIAFAAGFTHASSEPCRVALRISGDEGELSFADDCETLRLPDGSELRGDDGLQSMREAFLAFASGDGSQNRTPLRASRPFVLANNLMLLSSGGIHPVPQEHVQIVGTAGRTIYAIHDIGTLLRQGTERFLPLGTLGAGWAAGSASIETSDYSEHDLKNMLGIHDGKIPVASP